MTIEERMDKIERAFGAQDSMVRELRDAVDVTAALERRQAQIVRELAEARVEADARMRAHEERMRAHEAKMAGLDERIDKLVSAIGKFISGR